MKSVTRARAIGGSLVVTIPKEVVKGEGILPGELVEIDLRKAKRSFFGIARGIGPFTKKDEMRAHD